MGRVLLAGLAGAIVYFVWGMVAWTMTPLHTPTMNTLPNEQEVVDVLRGQNLETGLYVIPGFPDPPGETKEEQESLMAEFMAKHRAGPNACLFYEPVGIQPMAPSQFLSGLVIDFVASLIAAGLLSGAAGCCTRYWQRVAFVGSLGLFAGIVAHVAHWNWMQFPLDYTIAMVIDGVIGWILVGLVIAAIVQPTKNATKD